jgi:wyosine [tRNA(Phe)-imidazoG37] synthetase (radical SAM superfamily)
MAELMTLLSMKETILYGPVNSRRYGKSLGINLMPHRFKLCSFNCVYCHFGWTDQRSTAAAEYAEFLPPLDEVIAEVERAAQSSLEFNLLTFSGNGEPTLYPQFAELVDAVVAIRDRHRPDVKVALLSNSTGLDRDEVRASLATIDLPILKLDAGTAKTWRAINRPDPGIDYDTIVANLCAIDRLYIQSVLVGGYPSNTTPDDLQAYYDKITLIQPVEAHLYSIDRPVPESRLQLVPPERLHEIAAEGERVTGVRMRAFCKN